MEKLRVYIASPYTNGWQADNVRRQFDAQHILMDEGFTAFAPLTNHFSEIYRKRSEHEWFQWDLEWLRVCHILVRIRVFDSDGNETPSTGADEEMRNAKEWGIPCFEFKCLDELKTWAKNVDKKELFELFELEQKKTQ